MRLSKGLIPTAQKKCVCELNVCPVCSQPLELCNYLNGRKTVQTFDDILALSYRPKKCLNPECSSSQTYGSAQWQQIAPLYGTYGYDVIASIGWQRQNNLNQFEPIHEMLLEKVQISEAHVRHLYYKCYQPLMACSERKCIDQLRKISEKSGLILSLDGLAPESGEPQLWVIRELQTNLTIRSGWLSEQGQTAFENFLHPIVDLKLEVSSILSDKQRGLAPAIQTIFPNARHAFCQAHYLKNIAEPVANADEAMKVELRKTVRKEVGDLIRPEYVEQPGVMTVTGLVPSTNNDENLSDDDVERVEPDPKKSKMI